VPELVASTVSKTFLSAPPVSSHFGAQASHSRNRGSYSKVDQAEVVATHEAALAVPDSVWAHSVGMAHMEDDEVFGIVPEDVLQVIAYSMAELKTVEAVHIVAAAADDEAREVVEDSQDNLGMAAVAEAVQEWESRLLEQTMNSRAFEADTR